VYLEANEAPVIASYQVLPASPVVGDVMTFEVTATDSELDLLTYKWFFPALSLTLYGRKVFVSSLGLSPGSVLSGQVTVTDKMGASVTQLVESEELS